MLQQACEATSPDEKYLIPGEVQTPAIMFIPSESIYAELYTSFGDVVQQARRLQVVIMSPHVLMLAISTIQTLMRNAKMQEQAFEIQKEVGALLQDVKRLGDRVGDLRKRHFDRRADGDIKDISLIETARSRAGPTASATSNWDRARRRICWRVSDVEPYERRRASTKRLPITDNLIHSEIR